jgi:hypothetical protein
MYLSRVSSNIMKHAYPILTSIIAQRFVLQLSLVFGSQQVNSADP